MREKAKAVPIAIGSKKPKAEDWGNSSKRKSEQDIKIGIRKKPDPLERELAGCLSQLNI